MDECIRAAIEKHSKEAVALSDDLYAHPEVAGEEFHASEEMTALLRAAGYEVEYPYMDYPTGFCAVLKNGEGPSVGLLTEYDALPGVGHACGHNVHGSMSVLAALALAELRDRFRGTVKVFGTPAEEADGAKLGMSARGAFDDLALAVMIHSSSGGKGAPNVDLLSMRQYIVEFRGLSSHAVGAPWMGHSALAAARKFLDLVDARRECFLPGLYVNSVITGGGDQPNVLPARAEVRCEFRAGSLAALEELDAIVCKCARAAAMALDCEVSWEKAFDDFHDMVHVGVLEDEATRLFEALGQKTEGVTPASGSSDVGNVSYRCPTIQPTLSICDTYCAPHSPQMCEATVTPKAHEAIAIGGRFLASLALRMLNDDALRESVRAAFLEQRAKKRGEA